MQTAFIVNHVACDNIDHGVVCIGCKRFHRERARTEALVPRCKVRVAPFAVPGFDCIQELRCDLRMVLCCSGTQLIERVGRVRARNVYLADARRGLYMHLQHRWG